MIHMKNKKYILNQWTSILTYTIMFFAVLFPFHVNRWFEVLQISLVMSFFASGMNEIMQQLRRLNGENLDKEDVNMEQHHMD